MDGKAREKITANKWGLDDLVHSANTPCMTTRATLSAKASPNVLEL